MCLHSMGKLRSIKFYTGGLPSMCVTPEMFIQTLPRTLENMPQPIHGMFLTYNNMFGKDGLGDLTGDFNDHTTVITGLDVSTFMQSFGGSWRVKLCESAQSEVTEKALCILNVPRGTSIFVVVYAGTSAFQQAVDCAVSLRKIREQVRVFVLTCDCDQYEKCEVLNPLVADRSIDGYIVTRRCGGLSDMTRIHNAFLSQVV